MAWPTNTKELHRIPIKVAEGPLATSTPTIPLTRSSHPTIRYAWGPKATREGIAIPPTLYAVRRFDGVNDSLQLLAGKCAIAGNIVIAAIVKIDQESSKARTIAAMCSSKKGSSDGYKLKLNAEGKLEITGESGSSASTAALPIDSNWKLIVAEVRSKKGFLYVYDFAKEKWLMEEDGGFKVETLLSEDLDYIALGENGHGEEFCAMDIAALAIWPERSVAGQIKSLISVEVLREWLTIEMNESEISGLFFFNQTEVSLSVTDLTGNGANQSERVETEANGQEPPIPYGENLVSIKETIQTENPPPREYQLFPRGTN